MSRGRYISVGNDFIVPVKDTGLSISPTISEASAAISIPIQAIPDQSIVNVKRSIKKAHFHTKYIDYLHDHSLVSYALIILAIALIAQPLVVSLWPSSLTDKTSATIKHSTTLGLNISVPKTSLQSWLSNFTSQPATINLGTKTVAVNPNIIKSWLKITSSPNKSIVGIHLNTPLVTSSLASLAAQYEIKPVSEVDATRSDGTSEVAVYGQNGTSLSNPSAITAQAQLISKNLFSNNGFQISAPLVSVPFQKVTPASFGKLILVDVNSKNMYLYQNGQIVNTFLVSAGAPATPTPIGEFHIYEKLPLQNMTGLNTNGTTYFQPNVQWINYFDGGDAVHGVYWHPVSWFGVHNSSHGCVGITDTEAQWVYNWAPLGTTVITTSN